MTYQSVFDQISSDIFYNKGLSYRAWAAVANSIVEKKKEKITSLITASNSEAHDFIVKYREDLLFTCNHDFNDEEVINFIAYHVIILPILDAIYGSSEFTKNNKIAKAFHDAIVYFEVMLDPEETKKFQPFLDSIAVNFKNTTCASELQNEFLILASNFFEHALSIQVSGSGFYISQEIIDFINHSVNDLLKQDFGVGLENPNVNLLVYSSHLSPCIARLIEDHSLIPEEQLETKYKNDFHIVEKNFLIYYFTDLIIKLTYLQNFAQNKLEENCLSYYSNPFTRDLIAPELADAFLDEVDNRSNTTLIGENLKESLHLSSDKINVVLFQNVFSLWDFDYLCKSPNWEDILALKKDELLNKEQLETKESESWPDVRIMSKGDFLYEVVLKFVTKQVKDQGIIAFISNSIWLNSPIFAPIRQYFSQYFDDIYIYNLKGSARCTGEQRKANGANVFGRGCRAGIAIAFLVLKNKYQQKLNAKPIHFAEIADYLDYSGKIESIVNTKSILNTNQTDIEIDSNGDWFRQRNQNFQKFMLMFSKDKTEPTLFKLSSLGIKSNRDASVFNSSKDQLIELMKKYTKVYNEIVDKNLVRGSADVRDFLPKWFRWTQQVHTFFEKGSNCKFNAKHVMKALYRPFFMQFVYKDRFWIERIYSNDSIFPSSNVDNLVICLDGGYDKAEFSCLCSKYVTCLDTAGPTRCFPRYIYKAVSSAEVAKLDPELIHDGYIREDGISEQALAHFAQAYPRFKDEIDADAIFYYVYGLLHSPDYREKFKHNLEKDFARIPRVATYTDFKKFKSLGEKLVKLHADFDEAPLYAKCKIVGLPQATSLMVKQLRYAKNGKGRSDSLLDKTTIIYNDEISITNIPLAVQDYKLFGRSALDWVVSKVGQSVDRETEISNDFNEYVKYTSDAQYILHLILKVIYISLATNKIIEKMPPLRIHKLDSGD